MKIYKVSLHSYGGWLCLGTPGDVVEELSSDAEAEGVPFDREGALEKLQAIAVGDKLDFDWATVDCEEMSSEEYHNLPEFDGW